MNKCTWNLKTEPRKQTNKADKRQANIGTAEYKIPYFKMGTELKASVVTELLTRPQTSLFNYLCYKKNFQGNL